MLLKEIDNPVTLKKDKEIALIVGHWSVNAILSEYGIVLDGNYVVSVHWKGGGGFLSRKDWDKSLPQESTIHIIAVPRGGGNSNPLTIIATIVIMVAAAYTGGWAAAAYGPVVGAMASAAVMVAGSLLLNTLFGQDVPGASSSSKAKDVYSVNDGGNYLRIGQPFAERFGRQKIYPDLVQYSYTRYEDNEQYLYFYGIIGVGEYDIEGVFIDETLMDHYAEATYNILPPGTTALQDGRRLEAIPSIVTNVVWPCLEISGQSLDTEGVIGIASGRGTKALYIEYDLQFGALVGFNDDGGQRAVSVTVVVDVRLVDDDGLPTSDWTELNRNTYTAASIDTLRYTHKVPSPFGPGRYQVKMYRTTEESDDSKVRDSVTVMSVKAIGGLHPWYGDVTCIEAKIRASDKLSGDVVNKINVVATRKLPMVTDSGFKNGGELYPSKSIVDFTVYAVTCENGGRMGSDFIKWDVLSALKLQVDSLNHWFNWSFTSQTSVMDACKKAATCSRMVPYLPGGQFCLVRDDYQALPGVTYSEDDYDVNTFVVTNRIPDQSSPTCVVIKFLNEITWNDDSVTYYDERGSEDRPFEIILEGCQSRDQAYQYACYIYQDMFNNRTDVEFTTGLKGHIPPLFRKIVVGASSVDWGQHGVIVSVDEANSLIWLSEPVNFNEELSGRLFISQEDGYSGGPYEVTPTENPHCVSGAILGLKTLKDDNLRATKYIFGPQNQEFMYLRLMGIRPQGRNSVRIIGTIIDDTTYDLPGETPGSSSSTPISGLLDSVAVNYAGDSVYYVSWSGNAAAYKVEVNIGSGYTTVVDTFSGYSQDITTSATAISVRVTPYDNKNILQTGSAIVETYTIPGAPQNLIVSLTSTEVLASWDPVDGATSYVVILLTDDESVWEISTADTDISVLVSDLENISTSPNMDVEVYAINANGDRGDESSAEIPISALLAPSSIILQSLLAAGAVISWEQVTGADGYVLYLGNTAGFDPTTEGVLVYQGPLANATVSLDLTSPYSYCFKAAGTNTFYDDVDELVFSSSFEVSG